MNTYLTAILLLLVFSVMIAGRLWMECSYTLLQYPYRSGYFIIS